MAVPRLPVVSIERTSRSSDASGSVSFGVRAIVLGLSASVVPVSSVAVGGSLTPVIVTVTVAVSVPPFPSVMV